MPFTPAPIPSIMEVCAHCSELSIVYRLSPIAASKKALLKSSNPRSVQRLITNPA